MQVTPYLFFNGRCEEAAEFYRNTVGARITMLMHYRDSPDPAVVPPGCEDKVMHMSLQIGDNTVYASDGGCSGRAEFQGFALSLTLRDTAMAERLFAELADSGQVQMPLTETFFSPRFGMVADRFGVSWMIQVVRD